MINLLPPQQKKELFNLFRLRLILILGILSASFFLSFSLVLLTIKIYISGNLKGQRIVFEETEREFSSNKNFENEIEKYNLLLSNLDNFYRNEISNTQILEKIANILPPETYLTDLNFNPAKEKNEVQIALSGLCKNRDVLILLKKNLEGEKDFSEIYFPPGNWIKPQDINFNVTFKVK